MPTYLQIQDGPKADLPSRPDGVDAGYFSFPQSLFKSVKEPPGKGEEVSLMTNLIQGSVDEFLASARTGQAIPVDPIVVVIGLALIVLLVVARTVAVALGRRRETAVVVAQGGGV